MIRSRVEIRRRIVVAACTLFFMSILGSGGTLRCQSDTIPALPSLPGGSVFDYSGLGGIPMDVNIWGFVRTPGKYRVPSSTRLVELISIAGGPSDKALMDRVKVIRDVRVDSSLTQAVVIYDLARFQESGDTSLNPILYPGSTIVIEGDSSPNSFTEILSVVASVATIALSIVGIYTALNN